MSKKIFNSTEQTSDLNERDSSDILSEVDPSLLYIVVWKRVGNKSPISLWVPISSMSCTKVDASNDDILMQGQSILRSGMYKKKCGKSMVQ